MSGKVESPTEENWACYEKNIKYATKLLAENQIIGLIEPINNKSVPHYFMNSYDKGCIKTYGNFSHIEQYFLSLALSLVKSINSPYLKIMMDIFHLQHLRGNLAHSIHELLPFVGNALT